MTMGVKVSLRPATTEPATSRARLTRSMRRLPYMSPSRPTTGVATAPASSVAVIAQMVSDALAFRSVGSWGISGITRVCISETTIPEKASTITTAVGRGGADAPTGSARTWGMAKSPYWQLRKDATW